MSFANAAVLGCPEAYPGASAISYPAASTGYDFSGSSYTAPPLAGAAASLGHAVQTAVPATGGGYRVVAQAVPLGHTSMARKEWRRALGILRLAWL